MPPNARTAEEIADEAEFEEDPQRALELWQQAIALEPTAERFCGMAWVLLRDLERPQDALDAYREAEKLDPKDKRPHSGAADALGELGRREEAIAEYRIALAIDPDDLRSLLNIAFELHALGRHAEALPFAVHASERHPKEQGAPAYARASAHALLGERDLALEWLAKAVKISNHHRKNAREEEAFVSLRGDDRFRAIVGKK